MRDDIERSTGTQANADRNARGCGKAPPGLQACSGCPVYSRQRRTLLKVFAGLSALGLWSGGFGRLLAADKADTRPKPGDRLASSNAKKNAAKALTVDDIPENKDPLLVFPFDQKTGKVRTRDSFAGAILLKFKSSELNEEMTQMAGGGVLGYSQICTHAGCHISTYQPSSKTYFCFCHYSEYYPLKDGKVKSGPAPRPLPNLPLKLGSDGKTLVVAEKFNAPIGPQ